MVALIRSVSAPELGHEPMVPLGVAAAEVPPAPTTKLDLGHLTADLGLQEGGKSVSKLKAPTFGAGGARKSNAKSLGARKLEVSLKLGSTPLSPPDAVPLPASSGAPAGAPAELPEVAPSSRIAAAYGADEPAKAGAVEQAPQPRYGQQSCSWPPYVVLDNMVIIRPSQVDARAACPTRAERSR